VGGSGVSWPSLSIGHPRSCNRRSHFATCFETVMHADARWCELLATQMYMLAPVSPPALTLCSLFALRVCVCARVPLAATQFFFIMGFAMWMFAQAVGTWYAFDQVSSCMQQCSASKCSQSLAACTAARFTRHHCHFLTIVASCHTLRLGLMAVYMWPRRTDPATDGEQWRCCLCQHHTRSPPACACARWEHDRSCGDRCSPRAT
jgi:hypothetical protein